MTWNEMESSWNQLKGDLRHAQIADARESIASDPDECVLYKPSRKHGAIIRRRNPVRAEQAGWTAER